MIRTSFTLVLLSLMPLHADSWFEDIGLRFGFGEEANVDFQSFELFSLIDTDWEWDISEHTELEIEGEVSAGGIEGDDSFSGTAHVGFAASLEWDDTPLSLIIATGPTLITDSTFGSFDIGGNFHFTSSIGFDFEISECCSIGYRYQHISNAGLDDTNPGIDLHAFSASLEF